MTAPWRISVPIFDNHHSQFLTDGGAMVFYRRFLTSHNDPPSTIDNTSFPFLLGVFLWLLTGLLMLCIITMRLSARSQPLPTWEGQVSVIFSGDVPLVHAEVSEVRLFLSEESPSQVGLNSQDHLQAKISSLLPQGEAGSDDILPPGFGGTHASSQFDIKPSEIPVISWIKPPKIMLDLTWQVVAGEESKEIFDQHQREMRVLEAIYPRISSIPPNPISVDVDDSHYIDGHIVVIPITPVEDGDVGADTLSPGILDGSNTVTTMSMVSDVAAASVALTSLVKSSEHGNLIDPELLNNILNNPEVIEKLVRNYNVQNAQYAQNTGSSSNVFSHPPNPFNQVETTTSSSNAFSSTSSYTHTTGGQMAPTMSTQWHRRPEISSAIAATPVEVPSTKDVNYYKSLIQQHGGDKQEALPYSSSNRQNQQPLSNYDTVHNFRAKGSKPKIAKPCIFFNSSRGCRNGANCTFQHDASFQPQQGNPSSGMHSSKRMKMDNEISS